MSRPKVVRRTRPFSPDMQLGPWVVLPSHQDFTFPQTCVHSVAPTQRPFYSAINTHAVITPSFQSSLERKGNHTGWAEIRLSIIMKLSATSKGWAAGESTIYHSCAAPAIICTSPRRRAVGGGQRPSGLGACTAGSGKAAFPVGRDHGFQVIRGQPQPVCVLTTSTSIHVGRSASPPETPGSRGPAGGPLCVQEFHGWSAEPPRLGLSHPIRPGACEHTGA